MNRVKISPAWLSVFSDVLIEFAVIIFIALLAEIRLIGISNLNQLLLLIAKLIFGILTLVLAKSFREKS